MLSLPETVVAGSSFLFISFYIELTDKPTRSAVLDVAFPVFTWLDEMMMAGTSLP